METNPAKVGRIEIQVTPWEYDGQRGYRATVLLGGAVVYQSWTSGTKREARDDAKRVIEEMGLRNDGRR